jgi:hypothetical protein
MMDTDKEMRSILARSISANDMEITEISDWIEKQDVRLLIDILRETMFARREMDRTTTAEMQSDIRFECNIVTSVALQRIGVALTSQAIRTELHRRLQQDLEKGGSDDVSP